MNAERIRRLILLAVSRGDRAATLILTARLARA
jgi:hypothetical protein